MKYQKAIHAGARTDEFVFHRLIPYIGNKRKLLPLIAEAVAATGLDPKASVFVDTFAGTGVVSRWAKAAGYRTVANDWEPYAEIINRCYIESNAAPLTTDGRSYDDLIRELAALPGREDWVTRHLCPADDAKPDLDRERLFYMRKNGLKIDAIRERIAEWDAHDLLGPETHACLIAPLLFAACYHANTSGVFKGFHRGWGGQTGTALYRIAADLVIEPARFLENGQDNLVLRKDAATLIDDLRERGIRPDIAYLDPPYNQHPYGSNYHVLNSIALWDKPVLTQKIEGRGTKSAIRTDWRDERRSDYNHRRSATSAYRQLLTGLDVPWMATSYSTDGTVSLEALIDANRDVGDVMPFMQPYKRYRVSSQRFSAKPVNVEFVLLTRRGRRPRLSTDEIVSRIVELEHEGLCGHPEIAGDAASTLG